MWFQNLLLAALVLCLGALLWWLLLAPALHTLRQAPARHAQLDAQLQRKLTAREAAAAEKLQLESRKTEVEGQRQQAERARKASTVRGAEENRQECSEISHIQELRIKPQIYGIGRR